MKESSFKTTTSTANPISNGGARSQILFVIEQAHNGIHLNPLRVKKGRAFPLAYWTEVKYEWLKSIRNRKDLLMRFGITGVVAVILSLAFKGVAKRDWDDPVNVARNLGSIQHHRLVCELLPAQRAMIFWPRSPSDVAVRKTKLPGYAVSKARNGTLFTVTGSL